MSASFPPGGTVFSFTPIGGVAQGPTVDFRGTISSLSDSYQGNWQEQNDQGRADPKFMYSGFSRSISLDFIALAWEKSEHDKIIESLNQLTRLTKPGYDGNNGFNGPMCQMVIGDIINEKGFIESVDINIDSEITWSEGKPMSFNVGLQFRVVGEKRPAQDDGFGGLGNRRYGAGIKSNLISG